ncbi:transcription factor SFP1, partial [Phenoliferia sp. Uapishka_3]
MPAPMFIGRRDNAYTERRRHTLQSGRAEAVTRGRARNAAPSTLWRLSKAAYTSHNSVINIILSPLDFSALTMALPLPLSPTRSPLLHPALSTSLSRSFGLNSPFSLSALSSSLTALSSSPGFSSMSMSLGRSFEERPKLEAQFFRNFSCCGLDLQDLHGLLEHFEECHVAFEDDAGTEGGMEVEMDMDDGGSDGTISGPPSPRLQGGARNVYELKKSALGFTSEGGSNGGSAPDSPATQNIHLDSGMELDMEMDDAPPFHLQHNSHLPLSSLATTSSLSSSGLTSFQPPAMSAFDSPLTASSQLASASLAGNKKKFSTAMNAHAQSRGLGMGGMGGLVGLDALTAARAASAYSTPDSSIPGTPTHEINESSLSFAPLNPSTGLAPSLLFPGTPADSPPSDDGEGSSSGGGRSDRERSLPPPHPSLTLPPTTITLQNGGIPTGLPPHLASALGPTQLTALHPLGTGVQISPSGRPYTPPSEKPFKCSVPGCDKSYKQQNGLKYHRLHGHCNQNNVGKEGSERGEGKPYVCHVQSCGKRYKNMNGLRYHYQHSGAHGALGLQMLAQACHPPPQFPPGHKRANGGNSNTTSRAGSPAPSAGPSRGSSPGGFPRLV